MKQQQKSLVLILSIFGVISATLGQQVQVHLHQQQPQEQDQMSQASNHVVNYILPQGVPQQQQQQQQIQLQIQPQADQRYEIHSDQGSSVVYGQPEVVESAGSGLGHEESIAAESFAGAGAWEEAASVGSSAVSSGWNSVSEMFVNLGAFQMLLIPVILLSAVFMLYAAYSSPYNAQSHYLVDSIPGYGGYGGHGGYYGPDKWRRSLNSFMGTKIEELTPKVLDAIKNFAAKH